MGKRSGVPHRDEELENLTVEEIRAEIERCKVGVRFAGSAKGIKQWRKRIHWLESNLDARDRVSRP